MSNEPELSILEAIRSALIDEMGRDERVMVLGMDVGQLGGVFRVTRGLLEKFGPERVVDTPLAEGSIVGASLGLAIGGMVPVAEVQFLGFTHQAFHQIGPQLGRYRFRSRGRFNAQVTIRAPFGGGVRTPEFHPDAIEAQFAQEPGVKIVCPAFPNDAKGLLLEAIRDPDPVLYLEPQRLYRVIRGPVPAGDHTVPFGSSRVVREGKDVVLIAWSAAVHMCLAAADQLAQEGVAASVLDLRTLVPLDVAGLIAAVEKSG
ncbi:MAG TPA: transketolase C-terminal domain-containing protein, partial [Candidatus Acidoferrum sp.]|nr:transketolase C-terminal domain-containing protein [Candidatus Acidoferrum sp.]